jgi:hypothetical protein
MGAAGVMGQRASAQPAADRATADYAHGCLDVEVALPQSAGAGYQGAVGNGRVDDWRSLQTHIAWVNSHPQAGIHGCIFIPAATFLFTKPLNLCATVGQDDGSCRYPHGTTVEGMGQDVSILEPQLAAPGPALDFGGNNYAVLKNVGIDDASRGDHTSVAVLSSHGGYKGVAGDDMRLSDVTVNLVHSETQGAVGELFCATDVSSVDNNAVHTMAGPALIAGDGLGLAQGVVSSPFYRLASPRNPAGCNGNNGFTHFGLGANDVFVAHSSGTAVQFTGSSEYDSWGNIYVTGIGPMAPGHGIIDIIQTNSEGNWLNMLGIRTEYHGHSTGVHAIEMIHGGSRGGLLGGALTAGTTGFDFGCDGRGGLAGLTLEIDGAPTVTDCSRLGNLSGNVGDAKSLVPPGFAGRVLNVNLAEYGDLGVHGFMKNLNGAEKVINSRVCGINCFQSPGVPQPNARGGRLVPGGVTNPSGEPGENPVSAYCGVSRFSASARGTPVRCGFAPQHCYVSWIGTPPAKSVGSGTISGVTVTPAASGAATGNAAVYCSAE